MPILKPKSLTLALHSESPVNPTFVSIKNKGGTGSQVGNVTPPVYSSPLKSKYLTTNTPFTKHPFPVTNPVPSCLQTVPIFTLHLLNCIYIFTKNTSDEYVSLNKELENTNTEEEANKLVESLPSIKEAFAAAAAAQGPARGGG